jgi:dienelactone hydrolase
MVARGIADPEKLGIGGWSWGGYLTATTITRTTMFKAASMGAGLANLISDHGTDDIPSANLLYYPGTPYGEHADSYWRSSAMSHITACVTPTLILHGDADDRVPPTQGAEMWRALKTLGVPVSSSATPGTTRHQGAPPPDRHPRADGGLVRPVDPQRRSSTGPKRANVAAGVPSRLGTEPGMVDVTWTVVKVGPAPPMIRYR